MTTSPFQWMATAYHAEGNRMIARVVVGGSTRDEARDAAKMLLKAQGYSLSYIGAVAVAPLVKEALDGGYDEYCPVCKNEVEISEGAMGYYWYCPVCGPATIPLTILSSGAMIGVPPHILAGG